MLGILVSALQFKRGGVVLFPAAATDHVPAFVLERDAIPEMRIFGRNREICGKWKNDVRHFSHPRRGVMDLIEVLPHD